MTQVSPDAGPSESLTHRVSQGVVWLVAQAIGVKGINALTTLLLAALLTTSEFGVVATVYTVAAFARLAQQTGQLEILVQRQQQFRRWVNPAFWMSFTTGLVGMAAMAASGPIAAALYGDNRLTQLMLIMSISAPLDALTLVPTASLQIQMRFRELAILGIFLAVLNAAVTISFAAVGFGAMSYVLPMPLVSLASLLVRWRLAKIPVKWNWDLRRWRYMFRDSGFLFGIAATSTILFNGDNAVLRMVSSDAVLGAYFFAFGLSAQAAQFAISNVQSAMFPALSQIVGDPSRQVAAYLRATRISGMIGTFLCGLLAAGAAPGLHLLFGDKWADAVPVLQVLCLAMMIVCAFGPHGALFQAQGRFHAMFYQLLAASAVFLLAVTIGAKYGEALGVAIGACVASAVSVPVACYLAIRPGGSGAAAVLKLAFYPLAIAALTFTGPMLLQHWVPLSKFHDILLLAGDFAFCSVLFFLLMRGWMPASWKELTDRLTILFSRLRA